MRGYERALCGREHDASRPLIHQGPSKGLNDPRWREGACHQGWGDVGLMSFWGGRFKVVSWLVARPTYYITSWSPLLYLLPYMTSWLPSKLSGKGRVTSLIGLNGDSLSLDTIK